MKKKLLALLLFCAILSSCATNARELSVQKFSDFVNNSPDYNIEDGFFYNILQSGGEFLNINQAIYLSGKTEDEEVKKEVLEWVKTKDTFLNPPKQMTVKKYLPQIISHKNLLSKCKIFTREQLNEKLYLSIPLPESVEKTREEKKMAEATVRYINQKYSLTEIENKSDKKLKKTVKYFKKLGADSITVENLTLLVYPELTFPYIKANYTLCAQMGDKKISCKVFENYFLTLKEENGEFAYEVAYPFQFKGDFSWDDFQDNTYLFTSDMSSSYKVLPGGDIKISKNETQSTDSDIKGQFVPIKAQTVAEYLKIISNAKDVSEKYCLLTNQSWDLSSQLCTQSQDYLEKSVFVGDSIFQGFTFYKLQNANRVLSKVGVGSRNILLQTLENDGKEYLLQEFLKKKQPQYVYIMLGLNDINMIETQEYSANFKEIIALIKTTVPDADIVLCSMTPIRKMSFSSPKWIRKYNLVLQQIAQETKGVYYLDMFDYLSVNGILANKYSAGDGIHFTKKTYQMLVDYILIHQVRPYDFDNPDILNILHNTPLIIDEEKIKAVDEYSKNKGSASPLVAPAVEGAAP